MAGSPPNLHKMVSGLACIQGVLKVKVKVKCHVIRALLCWHKKGLFSRANGLIATKLAHDSHQISLHPGCAQGQGQGHVIQALLCWHKKGLFSWANGLIATKLAHDNHQVSLHPGCAQGQGQRSRDTRTFLDSWNELLRH